MARRKKPLDPRDFEGRKDSEIIEVITEDMRRASGFQRPYFEKFAEYYQQYNCIHESHRPFGSNLFIPYIYNIVETALPKILNSIYESPPFITYKPVETTDVAKGEAMTNLVYYQMKRHMKAATRFYEIYKSALINGTAYSKQTWKYQEKTVKVRELQDEEVELDDGSIVSVKVRNPVDTDKVVYDAPEFVNVPVEQLFFDPAYTDVDSSPFIIHEYYKEMHELKSNEKDGYYKNVSKVSEDFNTEYSTKLNAAGKPRGDMKDGVKIWEYWTDDWLVTVANGEVVLRVEENPFFHKRKPFVKWTPVPMPNEWFGKSTIENLTDLQAELNTIRNQRIDNVSLALNRMFLISKGAGIDVDQLTSRPNGYIEVDDVERDIKELIVKDVTSSAYRDEEIVKLDMDVTSGVHNHDRGQPGERRETATVASLLSAASSERFALQVLIMSEDSLTDLGWQLAELNKQFLDDDTYIMITGEDGEMSPQAVGFDDIDAEYDIIASSTATDAAVNKEVRKTQLIQLLNVAVNNPVVNQTELLRQIFKEFDFKNFDEMIMEQPPETPEETPIVTEDEVPEELPGHYPQMGGVYGLGNFLQQPTE